jgi:hypothetical protein
MELDKLHVLERGAGVIGQRLAVAGVFPTVAGDRVGPSNPTGREYHGPGAKQAKSAPLAVVADRGGYPAPVSEKSENGALHMHVDPLMDAVVLKRANHLQPGPVADVRQARVLMSSEVALENAAVGSPVEEGAPRLEFPNPIGRFLGMKLGHTPVVHVLPPAHSIGEMHSPVVTVVHIRQGGRDPSFGHDGVGFAEQGLAHQTDLGTRRRRRDCRPEPRAAGADDEDIVLEGLVFAHQILQSVQTPIEHIRTYKSANATENKLVQAQRMWARLKQLEQS